MTMTTTSTVRFRGTPLANFKLIAREENVPFACDFIDQLVAAAKTPGHPDSDVVRETLTLLFEFFQTAAHSGLYPPEATETLAYINALPIRKYSDEFFLDIDYWRLPG
jgi:hypothetical protein